MAKLQTGINDLQTMHPMVAGEWDYEKNGQKSPRDFTCGSSYRAHWKCSKCGHGWSTTINHRTRGTGCPKCAAGRQTSFPEQAIAFYLSMRTTVIKRYKISGREVDIYLPEYHAAIEYDGAWFHCRTSAVLREIDKNKVLSGSGLLIIRIKEEPMKFMPTSGGYGSYYSYQPKNRYTNLKGALDFICNYLGLAPFEDIDIDADREIIKSAYR